MHKDGVPAASLPAVAEASTSGSAAAWYTGADAAALQMPVTDSMDGEAWAGAALLAPEPAELPGHCPRDARTGLGVAGMLRRVGLHGEVDASLGRIVVRSEALERWLRHAFG